MKGSRFAGDTLAGRELSNRIGEAPSPIKIKSTNKIKNLAGFLVQEQLVKVQ